MSPYAYAYRTCKHPCAYACACVVRINRAYTLTQLTEKKKKKQETRKQKQNKKAGEQEN